MDGEDFGQLMARMRPRLHRYCARMMGSAFDGEDVVQDALAKASQARDAAGVLEHPENWLFRIAHNTALDALRRRRPGAGMAALEHLADPAADAAARVAAHGSFTAFLPLPPSQRASVILADVLGYSLAETGDILGASIAAVKAACIAAARACGQSRSRPLVPRWTRKNGRGSAVTPTCSTPAPSTHCATCWPTMCASTW
jgi:RNA polymerase sigma-70 factor, ECF subfamily